LLVTLIFGTRSDPTNSALDLNGRVACADYGSSSGITDVPLTPFVSVHAGVCFPHRGEREERSHVSSLVWWFHICIYLVELKYRWRDIKSYAMCGITFTRTVKCWGGVITGIGAPPNIPSTGTWRLFQPGTIYSCGLTFDDGRLQCYYREPNLVSPLPSFFFPIIINGVSQTK
jgi:hypothetical protein